MDWISMSFLSKNSWRVSQLETAGCETLLHMWSHTQAVMCYICFNVCQVFFLNINLCWLYITNIRTKGLVVLFMLFVLYWWTDFWCDIRCDFNFTIACLAERKRKRMRNSCPILSRLSCGWNMHDCELFISAYMCMAEVRLPYSYAISELENKEMWCRHINAS